MRDLEKKRAAYRKWYRANSEKKRVSVRKWGAAHPDKKRAADRKWYIANYEKKVAAVRKWVVEHPEKMREYRRKSKYNITPTEYQRLLEKQAGMCALCREKLTGTPHLDHDHKTDKVRGLLHKKCNSILGLANDDRMLLLHAVAYLRETTV